LHPVFDPQLCPERLTVPPSIEERAWRASLPPVAHLADEPKIFSSDETVSLPSWAFEWDEPEETLTYRVVGDAYSFRLRADALTRLKVPIVSDEPARFIVYCLQSLRKFDWIRGSELRKRYPRIETIQVAIQPEVARFFPEDVQDSFGALNGGWVKIASRALHL
jgi:hypothetical protein